LNYSLEFLTKKKSSCIIFWFSLLMFFASKAIIYWNVRCVFVILVKWQHIENYFRLENLLYMEWKENPNLNHNNIYTQNKLNFMLMIYDAINNNLVFVFFFCFFFLLGYVFLFLTHIFRIDVCEFLQSRTISINVDFVINWFFKRITILIEFTR
jgi:hypothetical protein